MASFMLIGGKLADIPGKKRTFLIGIVIFGIGTSIASFSTSLAMLIFVICTFAVGGCDNLPGSRQLPGRSESLTRQYSNPSTC
jgi:MFS family permease